MSGSVAWQIPLQANPQAANIDIGKAMSLADFAQQMREHQEDRQRQNTLRSILGQPGAIDPTSGMPSPQAFQAVMAVDPATGMKIQQNALAMAGERAKLQDAQLKRQGMIDDVLEPVRVDSYTAYQKALKSGMPKDAALAAGQRVYTEGLDTATQAGHFSVPEQKQLLPNFDPDRVFSRSPTLQKMQKDVTAETRETDTAAETRRHNLATEGDSTPAKKQERDVEAVADAKIADLRKANAAAGNPPPTDAEEAQARIDARNSAKPSGASVVSDDMADLSADRFLAGDKSAAVGFGRSPANQVKIGNAIAAKAKALGMNGADIARKVAEYAGETQAERTLGTRAVNMEIAANEVKYMAPLALSASEKVSRTSYPTLNSILLAAEKGTGNEDVVRFGLAANSLIYTYSKFLNPTGIPTDADKAKATEILSTAWSKGQFSTAIDQIKKEIASGQQGVAQTREGVGQTISPKGGEPASSGAGLPRAATDTGAAAPQKAGDVYQGVTAAQYDALPKGAHYTMPGNPRVLVKQ